MYHRDSRKARDGLFKGSHLDHVEKMHADGSGEMIGGGIGGEAQEGEA